jgi:hypothetical protein
MPNLLVSAEFGPGMPNLRIGSLVSPVCGIT